MDHSEEYVSTANCLDVSNLNDRITEIKQMAENKINEKIQEQKQSSGADELRITLLGSVQSGKSKLGNKILGSNVFASHVSPCPVTKCNQTAVKLRLGWRLKVTDTPAIDDLTRTDEDIAESIADLAVRNRPGPHVFLLVIQVGPYNPAFKNVITKLPEIFGNGMLKHTIVVFTHSDKLSSENITTEEFIGRDSELHNFVNNCHGYISTDNLSGSVSDVRQLIDKIENLVLHNHEAYYHEGFMRLPAIAYEEERKNKERKMETVVRKTVETRLKNLEQIAERHTRAINQLTVENSAIVEKLPPPNNDQRYLRRRKINPYDKMQKKMTS